MGKIEILDCTLRDGGYVNNWNFGLSNITNIINGLSLTNVEYVECGFISNHKKLSGDQTIYSESTELENLLKPITGNSRFALMMQVNNYNIEKLPRYKNGKVDILRLSFRKSEIDTAIDYALHIKEKGYKLFFQPTAINNYSENEMLELTKICNEVVKPEAFGIVDTLGVLTPCEIKNITHLFDINLDKKTKLLLHCHNNLQLAYANAIKFINSIQQERNIIVDTSLAGIGRRSGKSSDRNDGIIFK